ncbi:MAG: hypothetical protein O2819_01980 [Planctomycetota bacterium]|nr:hypothetical protein [Planctomycetota bacterium]MDA1105517.1 hypothetical protein [Planctomycetota bacterium]
MRWPRIPDAARTGIVVLAVAMGCGVPSHAGASSCSGDDGQDELVEVLRLGLTPWPDGRHHANLMSLRMLADPSLEPLYRALLESRDWTTRVDAVLGLAEVSESRSLDPTLIAALPDAIGRSAAITSAIGLELITPEVARALLASAELNSMESMVLTSLSREEGASVADTESMAKLAGSESISQDGMASLLLLGAGDAGPWRRFVNRMSQFPLADRDAMASELAQAAVAYRIPEAGPHFAALTRDCELSVTGERLITAARLALKDPGAEEGWRILMRRSTTRREQIKTALILLAEGDTRGSLSPTEPFPGGDELLDALHQALLRHEASASRMEALSALVALGHVGSAQAIAVAADRFPVDEATEIWGAMIEASLGVRSSPAMASVGLMAAAELAKVRPDLLAKHAQGAGIRFQESVLFALLRAGTAEAAAAAVPLRAGGGRKVEALALLAMAAQELPLTPEDEKVLARAATGGAELDPVLQVQAAWLVAKRRGLLELAITKIRAGHLPPPEAAEHESAPAANLAP